MAAAEMVWSEAKGFPQLGEEIGHEGLHWKEIHCPGHTSMEIWATHFFKKIQEVANMAMKKMTREILSWKVGMILFPAVSTATMYQQATQALEMITKLSALVLVAAG